MRFVETLAPLTARLLLAAGSVTIAACGSLPSMPSMFGGRADATAPAPTAAASATQAAFTTSTPPARSEPDRPVSPAAQRAFDEARRALRAGRTDEAERGFRALVQSNPELGGAHANLGLIYRQAGKLPEAVAALEQAVRVSPQQPLFFNQLGVAYRQQGRFTQAREAYDAAIALDPGYAAAVLNLGILNDLYLSDGPTALALYDRYLALAPGGDAVVAKWVVELKNRKPAATSAVAARKEKE